MNGASATVTRSSLLWAGDTSERGLRWNAVGSLSAAWPHWYLASEWPSAPSRSGASHPNQLRRSTVRPAPRLRLLHLCGTIQYCERHYCICFPAIQYWCSVSRDQRPARDAASHCDHAAALQVTAAPTPTLVITSAPVITAPAALPTPPPTDIPVPTTRPTPAITWPEVAAGFRNQGNAYYDTIKTYHQITLSLLGTLTYTNQYNLMTCVVQAWNESDWAWVLPVRHRNPGSNPWVPTRAPPAGNRPIQIVRG